MSRPEAWLVHVANLLVGGTGIAYALFRYVLKPDDPFASAHPCQAPAQHAHVVVAPLLVFALGMLPRAMEALYRSHVIPSLFLTFTILAASLAGWSARYSRLAGVAGAVTIPVLLLVAAFYPFYNPGLGADAVFFAMISLCPLGSAMGRVAARARRWAERFVHRPRLSASSH